MTQFRFIVAFLISILPCFNIRASILEKDFTGRRVSDALVEISKTNPGLKLNFIYDILEDYKVKGKIRSSDPVAAIRELVALNPISVREKNGFIYVEALQNGNFHYVAKL